MAILKPENKSKSEVLYMFLFIIGFLAGSLTGMLTMCLCVVAGKADRYEEDQSNEWEYPTKNHHDINKGSSWTCQRTYEIPDTPNVSWKPDPIYHGGQKISFQQRNIS